MAIKEGMMLGLLFVLAIEAFAIWLETRRERQATERGEWHLAQLLAYVEALPRPHQSMYVPAVAARVVDPLAVHDPRQRRVVEVTMDDGPTIEVTGEESLPRSARPVRLPNLSDDEGDETIMLTRVSQGVEPRRKR